MSNSELPQSPTRALPVTVPVLMALIVWVPALWPRPESPPPTPAIPPAIRTGTATELASAIRTSPRAMVYVCCSESELSRFGRTKFLEAAPDIGSQGNWLRFFVIEYANVSDVQQWAATLRDKRLDNICAGWLLWFEAGRLHDIYEPVFHPCYRADHITYQTQALWPR